MWSKPFHSYTVKPPITHTVHKIRSDDVTYQTHFDHLNNVRHCVSCFLEEVAKSLNITIPETHMDRLITENSGNIQCWFVFLYDVIQRLRLKIQMQVSMDKSNTPLTLGIRTTTSPLMKTPEQSLWRKWFQWKNIKPWSSCCSLQPEMVHVNCICFSHVQFWWVILVQPITVKSWWYYPSLPGGVVSHSASAQVEILAVGDTKPQFTQSTYSGTIEEERDPGTVIFKVSFSPYFFFL